MECYSVVRRVVFDCQRDVSALSRANQFNYPTTQRNIKENSKILQLQLYILITFDIPYAIFNTANFSVKYSTIKHDCEEDEHFYS